jgi:hypothetical protein
MTKKTMSKIKHSETEFTNELTVRRRAWIEKAVGSVRGRFDDGEGCDLTAEESSKSHLYVVKTDDAH